MHDTLLIVFIGILAVAVLAQSVLFYLMYRSIRALGTRFEDLGGELARHVESVSRGADSVMESVRGLAEAVRPAAGMFTESVDTLHGRVREIDNFLGEVTDMVRGEIVLIQDTVHTASSRIQETIEVARDCVLTPVSQVSAIGKGVRAALEVLFRMKKSPSRRIDDDPF
ncbi:MAG: hypothetical protein QM330_06110 [Acidobacteriota bacterium]|jgi:hypothetical protein|nr:hypothetical protein [Acidobacteriota bacterium]NLT33662.1 hypothetical protein [Acidobacteriota bacterium]